MPNPITSATSLPKQIRSAVKSAVSGLFSRKTSKSESAQRAKESTSPSGKTSLTKRGIYVEYTPDAIKGLLGKPRELKKVAAHFLKNALDLAYDKNELVMEFNKMYGSADDSAKGNAASSLLKSHMKDREKVRGQIEKEQAKRGKKLSEADLSQATYNRLEEQYVDKRLEQICNAILESTYKEADFKAAVQQMESNTNPLDNYANRIVKNYLTS